MENFNLGEIFLEYRIREVTDFSHKKLLCRETLDKKINSLVTKYANGSRAIPRLDPTPPKSGDVIH